MRLLDTIVDPADLRKLGPDEITRLIEEIRGTLITTVAARGGHLGSNLGIVELTVALHRVFDSPRDRILFDTGHQAYVHKLLTGRAGRFDTLRRPGGLSGYPSRAESPHDLIENSHASTALSYADGMAKANRLLGETGRSVVAVVGDGALTGGMAWEALNNLGARPDLEVVVVLNDNGRSYCPTVGGLPRHLADLRAGDRALTTVFENLGLTYLGPVDGHDLAEVEAALRKAKELHSPVVVHCVTRKGAGYGPAEADPEEHFHSPGRFDPATGRKPAAAGESWTGVFSRELVRIARQRPDVVGVTAAMLHPTGLHALAAELPGRVFDVGIAEQHAVTSAAGLASSGLHPVVAIYATFLNRGFDQVLLDVALHRLPVTFVLDRAGITGDDGPSHNGMWDLAVFQVVPGLRIAAPRDGARLRELLGEAVAVTDGPTIVRFPKGTVAPDLAAAERVGGLDVLVRGGRAEVLLVAVGAMAGPAVAAAEASGRAVTVVDPRWVSPVPPALVELAQPYERVLVVEDGVVTGGIGDAVRRALPGQRVRTLGVPARFVEHSGRDRILAEIGLTAEALARAAG